MWREYMQLVEHLKDDEDEETTRVDGEAKLHEEALAAVRGYDPLAAVYEDRKEQLKEP